MIHVGELDPSVTFAQGQAFVRAFGAESGADQINPAEQPLVYAEAVAALNPRRPTAEERAAAALTGEEAEVVRYRLLEKRRNWGEGHEELITEVAETMGLTAAEHPFSRQPDGSPTGYAHITAVEGANDQTYLRSNYVVTAHKAGLIVAERLVTVGTDRIAGPKETFPNMDGRDIADRAVERLEEENSELFNEGIIALSALRIRTHKAGTRDVLREAWLRTEPAVLAEGRVGVSTSAIYTPFMGHDAATIALELGVPRQNIDVAGLPAPATVRRNVATWGAEISQTLVSAAYHQHALNTRG